MKTWAIMCQRGKQKKNIFLKKKKKRREDIRNDGHLFIFRKKEYVSVYKRESPGT